jgi:putative heme-binding domain-containing protein
MAGFSMAKKTVASLAAVSQLPHLAIRMKRFPICRSLALLAARSNMHDAHGYSASNKNRVESGALRIGECVRRKTADHFAMRTALCLIIIAALSAPGFPSDEPPARSVADEVAVLEKGRESARRKALVRLATHADPRAAGVLLAQLDRLESGELPAALWLDVLDAAAKRDEPELKARLAARERELQKSRDPLARFRECLEGGDATDGRAVFTKKPEAGCTRCHSIDGQGGRIGPDLTWLRNSADPIRILESLIVPNSTIAAGFENVLLKLKSGEEVSGIVSAEGSEELTITAVADGRKRQVKTAEIVERTPLPSPMPPHFGAVLTKREIRDVVEFLAKGD